MKVWLLATASLSAGTHWRKGPLYGAVILESISQLSLDLALVKLKKKSSIFDDFPHIPYEIAAQFSSKKKKTTNPFGTVTF